MSTVSVIIRTFNRPQFLLRALADIAAQSLPPDEVIIVNDAGESAPIDEAISSSDLPIRVITNLTQLGRAEAANVGIQTATGDFITLHDDDDTWATDFLESTVNWLDDHPDNDAVVTKISIIYEQMTEFGTFERVGEQPFENGLNEITYFDLIRVNRFTPIGFVYRRAIHEVVGEYDTALHVVEDWDFHLRLAMLAPIPVIQGEPLAFWHQRPDATGDAGNSVIAENNAHRRFDLLKRDAELRLDPAGVGGLFYLTRFLDERFNEMHERFEHQRDHLDRQKGILKELRADIRDKNDRISRLEAAISDASFVALLRRRWRRFRKR